jgi:hypothetical protein
MRKNYILESKQQGETGLSEENIMCKIIFYCDPFMIFSSIGYYSKFSLRYNLTYNIKLPKMLEQNTVFR